VSHRARSLPAGPRKLGCIVPLDFVEGAQQRGLQLLALFMRRCSSSLLAVALAHRALREGELGTALAAGLHVQALPQSTAYVGAAAMLSPQGR
jgi:hypothetical protein